MGLPRLNRTLGWQLGWTCWALSACSADAGAALELAASPGLASAPLEGGDCEGAGSFGATDQIETYDSRAGDFRVHFTRAGRHAVPALDADGDGIPDYVREVADEFDAVLDFYRQRGYRMPLHAGEDRFSVYLVDFPTTADGQYCRNSCDADSCSGYMLLENDFKGRHYASTDAAIRLLASHELFHGVQAAYAAQASLVLSEGTAVWASEAFDSAAGDLEAQVPGYLMQPENPLGQDPAGTFDNFAYGSALFFEYLSESVDPALIRELWEALADGAHAPDSWPAALDGVLRARASSLAEQFGQFAEWNLYTGARADPSRAYASGAMFPEVTEVAVDGFSYEKSVRVYPLAARYYALQSQADQTLFAKADLPADTDGAGLELLLAREHAGEIADVERAGDRDERALQLQVAAGDTLHVVLLNTRHEGESARPSLCIGALSDMSRCGAAPVSESAGDAGTDADQPAAPHHDADGCSVVTARPAGPAAPISVVLCLALLLLRQRRR